MAGYFIPMNKIICVILLVFLVIPLSGKYVINAAPLLKGTLSG